MLGFVSGLPGGVEWLIILVVALLIFGSRLPSVMRSMGRSINEFKRGLNESTDEVISGDDQPDEPESDEAEAEPSDTAD